MTNERCPATELLRTRLFTIEVPATSGNLGPGFDVAGMAMTIYNRLEVAWSRNGLVIEARGEGADSLPRDTSNIVVEAMQRVFKEVSREMPDLHLRLLNRIPLARGMGSSAAARVAGVMAANELLPSRKKLDDARLLALATELEGHPDNVAPALFGGIVLSSAEADCSVCFAKLKLLRPPQLVAVIPAIELATSKARAVLPTTVPMRDAVFNVGRTALLVAGFSTGRDDLLRSALQDRLHQPYRAKLMPWLPACIRAAKDAGALGAILSGAGTTMLAFTRSKGDAVGDAMLRELRKSGADGVVKRLRVSARGARVICD